MLAESITPLAAAAVAAPRFLGAAALPGCMVLCIYQCVTANAPIDIFYITFVIFADESDTRLLQVFTRNPFCSCPLLLVPIFFSLSASSFKYSHKNLHPLSPCLFVPKFCHAHSLYLSPLSVLHSDSLQRRRRKIDASVWCVYLQKSALDIVYIVAS